MLWVKHNWENDLGVYVIATIFGHFDAISTLAIFFKNIIISLSTNCGIFSLICHF
jgi:hypothetical protein